MKNNINLWSFLVQFVLEWEMFETKVVKEVKTRILCSAFFFFFFRKSILFGLLRKTSVERTTDNNTAHAHYMLGT